MNRRTAPQTRFYRAALCLSSGLLLSGLVGERAIAQSAETVPAETVPAESVVAYASAPRPLTESFLVESKPPLDKPALFQPIAPSAPVTEPAAPVAPQEIPTRLVLKLNQRRVEVYRGETLEASYPVAVGKAGWETPTGDFTVLSTIENPGWTSPWTNEVLPPGPDSPLGERWIGFWTDGENVIGFHGTPNRASIGQAASHGCVRMYNEHIRELYELVGLGTPVTVVL